MLEAESTAAKALGVPWSQRGPRFGPEEGGPTTWRGSVWRPQTKKWATRGGRNLAYWSQVYKKNGEASKGKKGEGKKGGKALQGKSGGKTKGGKGSSSSSSAWIPNPLGKGKSEESS